MGQAYGLVERFEPAVLNPVDARGTYLPSTPPIPGTSGDTVLAGVHIWKANALIVEALRDTGALLAHAPLEHSYPHCWRHKTPVAFRATPQWFISMEQANLRSDAVEAIGKVAWFPDWGEARIAGMVEGRPDWCISRQRTWGVPIALFVHKVSHEPHPRSVELMGEVANLVERDGIDAWHALDPTSLLGNEAGDYEKSYGAISRVQKILTEMSASLKHDVYPEMCGKLASLYNYAYRKLIEANDYAAALAVARQDLPWIGALAPLAGARSFRRAALPLLAGLASIGSIMAIVLLGGPTASWLLYRFVVQPRTARMRLRGIDPSAMWVCANCRSINA